VLPGVVLVREDARLSTNSLLDLLDSNLLVLRAGNSLAVGVTRAGPSDLGDVGTLLSGAGADLCGLGELLNSKLTGLVGGDSAGEVRVDLAGEDVDVVAKSGAVLLPGADGLGGGDGNVLGETGALERLADVVDVATESRCVAVAVKDALVADDDHGDAVLGRTVLDGVELLVGVGGERSLAAGTTALEEDAVDDLEAVLLALGNNGLEDTAVGAVGADRGEAHLGDVLDVGLDLVGSLAVAVLSIGSVGHGPLVAVGDDVATGAVAAGGLGLVSRLGAAGSRLGGVGGHRLLWLGRSGRVDLRWLGSLRLGGRNRVGLCGLGGLRLGGRSRVDLCWLAGRWRRGRGRDHNGGVDGSLGLLLLGAGSRSLRRRRRRDPGGVGDDGRH
jgi:hypothetical protein